MAKTLQPLLDIPSGAVGSAWYGKINDNNAKITTAFSGGLAEAVHTHAIADVALLQQTLNAKAPLSHTHSQNDIVNFSTHTHTGSYVNVTQSGSSKTLQSALDYLLNQINGLVTYATITGITISGADSNMSIITATAGLSARAFGVFDAEYYFDNLSSSNNYATATKVTGTSSQVTIPKPSTGWDSNNQQYLHIRFNFTNMSNTTGAWVTSNNLINKFSKDLTEAEIASFLVSNTALITAIARELAGRKDFRSDIATTVNSM